MPVITENKQTRAGLPLSSPRMLRQRYTNVFMSAVLIFLLINVSIRLCFNLRTPIQSINLAATDTELRTIGKFASWWLAKAYFAEPKSPDVVVLGSSQIGALQCVDAYVYKRIIDATDNHRSYTLEHDLESLLGQQFRVLICGISGAMISDQLIISRSLFSDQYKPRLVVVTFSPRDFIDSICPSPNSTEPFSFFSKYIDLGSDLDLFFSNVSAELDWKAITSIPLRNVVRDKFDLQSYDLRPSSQNDRFTPLSMTFGKPFERVKPGQFVVNFADDYGFRDNTKEYQRRYRNALGPQLNSQLRCLDNLFSYLASRHIKAVAFGLPLTEANRNLLSKNFWGLYNGQISRICRRYKVDWVDFSNQTNIFSKSDFVDTIHLNLIGALKLSRPIALRIADKLQTKNISELVTNRHKIF